MSGGGGPACLRLRVQLESQLLPLVESRFYATEQNLEAIRNVVSREWPDRVDTSLFDEPGYVEHLLAAADNLRLAVLGPREINSRSGTI